MTKPTGSLFPEECGGCKHMELARIKELFTSSVQPKCVKYNIPVSEHKDACREWEKRK